jgi:hypothetical protein
LAAAFLRNAGTNLGKQAKAIGADSNSDAADGKNARRSFCDQKVIVRDRHV